MKIKILLIIFLCFLSLFNSNSVAEIERTFSFQCVSINLPCLWRCDKISTNDIKFSTGAEGDPNYWTITLSIDSADWLEQVNLPTTPSRKLYDQILDIYGYQDTSFRASITVDEQPCYYFVSKLYSDKTVYGFMSYYKGTLIIAIGSNWIDGFDVDSSAAFRRYYESISFDEPENIDYIEVSSMGLFNMSISELAKLKDQINYAIWNSSEWQEVTVPQGVWHVGEDIPAGTWTVKCAEGYRFTRIDWGDSLLANGEDIAWTNRYSIWNKVYDPNYRYYDKSDGPTTYSFTVYEGEYVIINSAPAVFMPYHGKPSFGFK